MNVECASDSYNMPGAFQQYRQKKNRQKYSPFTSDLTHHRAVQSARDRRSV